MSCQLARPLAVLISMPLIFDGKTTSTHTYNQPGFSENNDLSNDTTWLTTAQDGSKWDCMESDFVSSRLKQPVRPTPIATTTTTKPTTLGQTTHATEAHDHDEGGADVDGENDDDILLILSNIIES